MFFGRKLPMRVTYATTALLFVLSGPIQSASPPANAGQNRQRADAILILKRDHVMELLANGRVIRTYKVALGQGGLSPKQKEGDARTPEGHYLIDAKYEHSKYHKALH